MPRGVESGSRASFRSDRAKAVWCLDRGHTDKRSPRDRGYARREVARKSESSPLTCADQLRLEWPTKSGWRELRRGLEEAVRRVTRPGAESAR
jgi:hypothetical protein